MANNLPIGAVRGLHMPSIPLRRQLALRDLLLDEEVTRTASRTLMTRSIALLNERKQALITDAVTGQFDVTTAKSEA